MLPCVCSIIDHRRRQNVVRTSVTHSAVAWCATFLLLLHFDVRTFTKKQKTTEHTRIIREIRELKHRTFLIHGRQPEV